MQPNILHLRLFFELFFRWQLISSSHPWPICQPSQLALLSLEQKIKQGFYAAGPKTVLAPMYEAFARGKMVPTEQCSATNDQVFLTALQQEDASRIYIVDPMDHVDRGFAGLKDMRADLLAPFIAALLTRCRSI